MCLLSKKHLLGFTNLVTHNSGYKSNTVDLTALFDQSARLDGSISQQVISRLYQTDNRFKVYQTNASRQKPISLTPTGFTMIVGEHPEWVNIQQVHYVELMVKMWRLRSKLFQNDMKARGFLEFLNDMKVIFLWKTFWTLRYSF